LPPPAIDLAATSSSRHEYLDFLDGHVDGMSEHIELRVEPARFPNTRPHRDRARDGRVAQRAAAVGAGQPRRRAAVSLPAAVINYRIVQLASLARRRAPSP
jgi:hypothetical protein